MQIAYNIWVVQHYFIYFTVLQLTTFGISNTCPVSLRVNLKQEQVTQKNRVILNLDGQERETTKVAEVHSKQLRNESGENDETIAEMDGLHIRY